MTESDKPRVQSRPPSCAFMDTMGWAAGGGPWEWQGRGGLVPLPLPF